MPLNGYQFGAADPAGPGEQSQKDAQLVALCNAMVASAKTVTNKWADLWESAVRYLFNDQLRNKDRKEGWPAVQLNTLFPAVIQEMAVQAQRKPDIEAVPEEGGDRGQGDQQAAQTWRGILKYDYERTLKMPKRCRQGVLDGKLHGYWVGYAYWDDRAYWDDDLGKWVGAPAVRVVHPRRFGMDPNAEDLDEAEFCYLQVERSVEACLARWPERKEIILRAAEKQTDEILGGIQPEGLTAGQYKAESERDKGLKQDRGEGMLADLILEARKRFVDTAPEGIEYRQTGRTMLVTGVWFKDRRTKKVTVNRPLAKDKIAQLQAEGALAVNATGQVVVGDPEHEVWAGKPFAPGYVLSEADWPVESETVEKPMFPNGRVVWMVGDELLNPDEEEQVHELKRPPFRIGVNAMLPHMWQGLNGIEMGKGIQDWMNISATKLLNWLMYFADPVLLVEEGALAAKQTAKGETGGVLRRVAGAIWNLVKGRVSGVQYLNPPALPNGAVTLYEMMHRVSQDLTGIHNPALGAASKGGPTATEIATLQTSTQTRQGLQITFLDEWVRDMMELVAEIRQVHMSEGDTVRLLGDKGQAMVAELAENAASLRFDVRLKVGTSLPFDDERQKQDGERLKGLFPQNPEIDRLVLERFKVDNVDEILQAGALYQQFLQFLQQMQAAEQAAPQGPPSAVPQG